MERAAQQGTPTRQLSKFLRPDKRDRQRSSSKDPAPADGATSASGSTTATDTPARPSSSSSKMLGKKTSKLFSRSRDVDAEHSVSSANGMVMPDSTSAAPGGGINDPPVIIEPPSNAKPRSRPPRPSNASDTSTFNVPGAATTSSAPINTPGNTGSMRNLGDISSRLSGWFNQTFTGSSSDLPALLAQSQLSTSPSNRGQLANSVSMGGSIYGQGTPAKKVANPLALVAKSGKDHLDKAMRYLLDSDAQPDKSQEKIWLLGVEHPGYEPPPPPSSTPTNIANSGYTTAPPPSTNLTVKRSHRRDSTDGRNKSPSAFRNPIPISHSNSSTQSLTSAVSTTSTLASSSKDAKNALQWPADFYSDYTSRIWMTYRNNFSGIRDTSLASLEPPISCSLTSNSLSASISNEMGPLPSPQKSRWPWSTEKVWTSDAGWGCMLRTGQSLLANALIHLHLSRNWRRPNQPSLSPEFTEYVKILTWFLDTPSPLSPFGVHRMALAGKEMGKDIGTWFGPSTAAGAIKRLVSEFGDAGLEVVVALDRVVYESEVYAASNVKRGDAATTNGNNGSKIAVGGKHGKKKEKEPVKWGGRPVLILVNTRLGIDSIHPTYYDNLKALFTYPETVGIAGGRPSSSYYFVGAQGDSLYYLDPHHTRPAVQLRVPPSNLANMSFDEASLLGLEDTGSVVGSSQASQASSKLGRRRGSEIFMQGHTSTPDTSESERKSTKRLSIRRASLNRMSTSYHPGQAVPTSPASIVSTSSSHAHTSSQQSSIPLSSSPLARSSLSTAPHSSTSPPRARSSNAISSMVAMSSSPPANGNFPQSPVSPSSSVSTTPMPPSFSSPTATPLSPSNTSDSHHPLSASTATIDPMSAYLATSYSMNELRTFHSDRVRKMPISGMDPSMLLGFLCRDEAEWKDLKERIDDTQKTKKGIFSIQQEPPSYPDDDDELLDLESASEEMDDDDDEMMESPVGDDDDEEGEEGEDNLEVKRRQTIEAKRENEKVATAEIERTSEGSKSSPDQEFPRSSTSDQDKPGDEEDEDDSDEEDEDDEDDDEEVNAITPVARSGKHKAGTGRHDTIIGRARTEVVAAAAAVSKAAVTEKPLPAISASATHDRNDSRSTNASSSTSQSHDRKDSRGHDGDNDDDLDDEDDDDEEWVDPIKPLTPSALPSGSRHTKVISVDSNGSIERTDRSSRNRDDTSPTPTPTPAPNAAHYSHHRKTASMTRELPAIPTTVVSMSREPRSREPSGGHSRESSSRPSSSSKRLSQIALTDTPVPFPTGSSVHRKQSSASSRSATSARSARSASAASTPASPGSSPASQYPVSAQQAAHAHHSSHSSASYSSHAHTHTHHRAHHSGTERDAMSLPFPGSTTDESGATSSDSALSSDAWAGDEKVGPGRSLVPKRERKTTVGRTAPIQVPVMQQQPYGDRGSLKAKHGGRTTSGGVRAVWEDKDGDDF